MASKIWFRKQDNAIVIEIPIDLISFAATNNPDTPFVVKNEDELAEKVLFQLEHGLGEGESGLPGFYQLLDKAITEIAESSEDCIEFKT